MGILQAVCWHTLRGCEECQFIGENLKWKKTHNTITIGSFFQVCYSEIQLSSGKGKNKFILLFLIRPCPKVLRSVFLRYVLKTKGGFTLQRIQSFG